MPITWSQEEGKLVAAVSGEVDHHAARTLLGELNRQLNAVLPRHLILDLGGVTFMDSSGIALVLRSWKQMGELEGAMELRAVPVQAAKVLRAAGVDRLIPFP